MADLDKMFHTDEHAFTTIDPAILDAANEIGKTLLTGGMEAWGVLLGRGVLYTEGDTSYQRPADQLSAELGPCMVSTIAWSGDRKGTLRLVVPELGAKGAVAYMMALMMGSDATPETTLLDEEGLDAYREAVNNLVGSAAQALRGAIGGDINLVAQESALIDLSQPGAAETIDDGDLLIHSGQIIIEGMVPVDVHILMPVSVTGHELAIAAKALPMASLPGEATGPVAKNIDATMHIKLPVRVILAEKRVRMEVVQELAPGSIIEFRKLSGEHLDITAGRVKFAEGEVVITREHFGIQIRKLLDMRSATATA